MIDVTYNQIIQEALGSFPGNTLDRATPESAVLDLEANERGRDFFAGDVHGHFGDLERSLDLIGFDSSKDRLICVGDLIDRGPDSERSLEWLRHDWFFSVRGNHEQMAIESALDGSLLRIWMLNGGGWADGLPERCLDSLKGQLSVLPYAISVKTTCGQTIGVTHAEVPIGLTWQAFCDTLREEALYPERYPVAQLSAIWGRIRISAIKRDGFERLVRKLEGLGIAPEVTDWLVRQDPAKITPAPKSGIRVCAVGHTPVPEFVRHGDVAYLDTGHTWKAGASQGAALQANTAFPLIDAQELLSLEDPPSCSAQEAC
ncbi:MULTISPECIES: metallophosphoesterase [unclassified Thioalkalivibrio]|uniref:metallophosphoesterase n=1 Tax=unclassified Thioalkalivibrio TaxID=2621013 RepID=UPI000382407D|nr:MULTISPECIES: metallophosphoesterase [unclassified Thioalkalivibrio]